VAVYTGLGSTVRYLGHGLMFHQIENHWWEWEMGSTGLLNECHLLLMSYGFTQQSAREDKSSRQAYPLIWWSSWWKTAQGKARTEALLSRSKTDTGWLIKYTQCKGIGGLPDGSGRVYPGHLVTRYKSIPPSALITARSSWEL
jgi:hypothetical protein